MAKLLKYLKPKEWLFALFAAGFIVLQVWLEIKIPDYMATLTATFGLTVRICSLVRWGRSPRR